MRRITIHYHLGDMITIDLGDEQWIYTATSTYFSRVFWKFMVKGRRIESEVPNPLIISVTNREYNILYLTAKYDLVPKYRIWRTVLNEGLSKKESLKKLEEHLGIQVLASNLE